MSSHDSTPREFSECYILAAQAEAALEDDGLSSSRKLVQQLVDLSGESLAAMPTLPRMGALSPAESIGSFLAVALEMPALTRALSSAELARLHTMAEACQRGGPVPEPARASFLQSLVDGLAGLMPRGDPLSFGLAADSADFKKQTTLPDGSLRWLASTEGGVQFALGYRTAGQTPALTIYLKSDNPVLLAGPFQLLRSGQVTGAPSSPVLYGPGEAGLDIDLTQLGGIERYTDFTLVAPGVTLDLGRFAAKS
jgi:hypothetical protein